MAGVSGQTRAAVIDADGKLPAGFGPEELAKFSEQSKVKWGNIQQSTFNAQH
jgi:hypothetical protein